MKGYLQRLAAQAVPRAAGSAGKIHPIIGSIYAAPKENASDAFPQEIEQLISAPKPATIRTQSSIASNPLRPNPEQEESQSREHPRLFQPLLGRTDAVMPLPRTQERPQANPPDETAQDEKIPPHVPSQKPAAAKAPSETPIQQSALLVRHAVPQESIPAESKRREVVKPQPALARRYVQPAANPRSAPPSRGTDEIQINIGRIEVTAVSQAAQRPASAPVHKALNLGEYLKGRNGRG
jgi:hypothetical protein